MNYSTPDAPPPPRAFRAARSACLLLVASFLSAGVGDASAGLFSDLVVGPNFHPENVYSPGKILPPHIRRVAVLPIATAPANWSMVEGRDSYEQILYGELQRRNAFEVVLVTPAELKVWTGRERWSADSPLPPNFLETLRNRTGCDAFLLSKLTAFNPYPPLSIGWNLKLVDAETPSVWWAADTVFDAGHPPVANSARRFHKHRYATPGPGGDSKLVLSSPRRFGHYTLHALFNTLPSR